MTTNVSHLNLWCLYLPLLYFVAWKFEITGKGRTISVHINMIFIDSANADRHLILSDKQQPAYLIRDQNSMNDIAEVAEDVQHRFSCFEDIPVVVTVPDRHRRWHHGDTKSPWARALLTIRDSASTSNMIRRTGKHLDMVQYYMDIDGE